MQFTSTIIVALLAVSPATTFTAAQKFSNLRGGDGHKLHHAETVLADPSADEATPATSDHVPALHDDPERSLVEGWFDGCPWYDTPDKNRDDDCPDGQIMCVHFLTADDRYCYDPHPVICPGSQEHLKDRDSECPTGQIMCYDKMRLDNWDYCHKY